MNSPSLKNINLRSIHAAMANGLRSIYTPMVIGFALLLLLIGWIGTRSSSKFDEISFQSRDNTNDYMSRLRLALEIREAATEVVAEARVYRASQKLKVSGPPFSAKLRSARKRFQDELEKGRDLWGKRNELKSLPEIELAAWREVESASQKYLDSLNELGSLSEQEDDPQSQEPNPPGDLPQKPQQNPSQQPTTDPKQQTQQPQPAQTAQQPQQPGQNNYLTLRNDLDKAARQFTESVSKGHSIVLNDIAGLQHQAANVISKVTGVTLLVGFGVAVLSILIVRAQLIKLREANRQEQVAKDFATSIFDSQSNYILVVGNNGKLLAVNQAFMNHFKLSAPPPISQEYGAALSHLPEVAAFVGKTLGQPDDSSSLRERIEVRPQYGQIAQNGSASGVTDTRLFDVYTSPLTIGGQPDGRVVVLVDVTESEKVREELRRSRTLSAVGQITATVAHELYNPIGAVKLNLDLLEMQISGDGDVKHTVARLKRGVEHLSTIVMDLRYLTRPRNPEPRTTDLNKLLDEVVELASDRLERSRINVDRNYAVQLPKGQFDPQQLRKVFLNLLINAVEASPHNSNVELRTQYVDGVGAHLSEETNGFLGELIISVIDRGVGMSDETKRRLFEAFYTTKRNGTGLGMMITQEIIKKHGGKIEVDSEEGKGTTVSVYLPV